MPWQTNDDIVKSIPSLKSLPSAAITLFREVANRQIGKGDAESTAVKIAWEVVKKRFKKEGDMWVARTESFIDVQYYTFDSSSSESFITRTENGTEVHNFVLSDLWPDNFGTAPKDESMLVDWASWVNEKQPEIDADHELFESAKKIFNGDIEQVSRMVSSKKGIAKAIGARVDKGRLLVSVAFDKRYSNHVDKVKGLSIEGAFSVNNLTKKYEKGKILGMTFAINKSPGNPRAVRV